MAYRVPQHLYSCLVERLKQDSLPKTVQVRMIRIVSISRREGRRSGGQCDSLIIIIAC